jgi:hypothetical protein
MYWLVNNKHEGKAKYILSSVFIFVSLSTIHFLVNIIPI